MFMMGPKNGVKDEIWGHECQYLDFYLRTFIVRIALH